MMDRWHECLWQLPDALVLVRDDGAIVFANDQVLRMFGYSQAELIGQRIEMLIPQNARSRHEFQRRHYFGDPRIRPLAAAPNLVALRKDGLQFPVEISLTPISVGTGKEVLAVIRDISQRQRVEDEAHIYLQRLIEAVEITSDAFIVFDPSERIALCNSAARTLFATVMTRPLVGLSHDQLLAAMNENRFLAVGNGGNESVYARLRNYYRAPQGHIDVETTTGLCLRITSRRTPEGGMVSILADLTEDRQRELDLRQAQCAADRASRAKSDFLASMSHELRTPLNAILGFAQLLLRDKKGTLANHQQDYVHHILTSGEHLLHLIDDVLDLARIESGGVAIACTSVAVRTLLDEVVHNLEPQTEAKQIRISIVGVTDIWVTADLTRLRQILLNFGSNAIKYGREGGVLVYEVTRTQARVRIDARDDGPGIPLENQPGLFQPFNRAGQEMGPIEGTGIGLSISKLLAERMGGSVGFESTPGTGSVFWVELPIAEPVVHSA